MAQFTAQYRLYNDGDRELRLWTPDYNMALVTIPKGHTPKAGDMIERSTTNHNRKWLVSQASFLATCTLDDVQPVKAPITNPCAECGRVFTMLRKDHRYCSDICNSLGRERRIENRLANSSSIPRLADISTDIITPDERSMIDAFIAKRDSSTK